MIGEMANMNNNPKSGTTSINISEPEISAYTKNLFMVSNQQIVGKTNPFNGERAFVLCSLEQLIGLLSFTTINDQMIIQHTKNLLRSSNGINEYQTFLNYMSPSQSITERALSFPKLTTSERQIINELLISNYNEYLMKSDYVRCCYSAMNAFLVTAYCIITRGIDVSISDIDITVDIYDTVQNITLNTTNSPNKAIYIDWHSTNRINDLYMLYKTQYCGLTDASILDLVSADVIEEEYYLKDDRFTIAPSILMKQYLSIIEREVNEIIQLSGLENIPKKHLNWYDMKNLVRKRGINIDFLPYKLYEPLDELYQFRNSSMHGETDISKEDYEILCKYKNQELFKGLSIKKLQLSNTILHPTVDEIANFIGLSQKP